jgi:cysteine desulfuration protein SufE
MNFDSCLKKQEDLQTLLSSCPNRDLLYQRLMELGKSLPPYPELNKTSSFLVAGCQSQMYLCHQIVDNNFFFYASSDALISSGLAALLLSIYNGEPAEVILKCPPTILQKLNIASLLTPSRASGLASIHLRIKQEALRSIVSLAQKFDGE